MYCERCLTSNFPNGSNVYYLYCIVPVNVKQCSPTSLDSKVNFADVSYQLFIRSNDKRSLSFCETMIIFGQYELKFLAHFWDKFKLKAVVHILFSTLILSEKLTFKG